MALDDIPNKLESVFVQRDTQNEYYGQINVSGSDLIFYHSSSGIFTADKISTWAAKYGIGTGGTSDTASFVPFDGDRSITRDDPDFQGLNVGGTNVVDFLNNFFFPFLAATISINSGTSYYETGSAQSITINGSITANSETVFDSGSIRRNGVDWYTFNSASSYSTSSNVSSSFTYRTYMGVGNNGSPTLIYSSLKTVSFIYPYLWGMSTGSGLNGTTLYSEMSRSITIQGTKSDSFIGTSTYIYFCYPSTYADLTSIKDPNNFEVLSSFEYSASVPVTSSGLTTNWMNNYKVYRLILQGDPNGTYTFYY